MLVLVSAVEEYLLYYDVFRLIVGNSSGDVYEIIGCGAEELQTKGGLGKESIDTIITVQCLCSIPTPEIIIRELFPLLKPGGQWLVYEHVKTKFQSDFVAYWQSKFACQISNAWLTVVLMLMISEQRASTSFGRISSMAVTSHALRMNGCSRPGNGRASILAL